MTDRQLREKVDRLQNAMFALLKTHLGDRVERAGARYAATHATFTFRVQLAEAADLKEAMRKMFEENCFAWGLKSTDFDLPIVAHSGSAVTLTRIELGRSRYPFLGTTAEGKLIKFGPEKFMAARGRQRVTAS